MRDPSAHLRKEVTAPPTDVPSLAAKIKAAISEAFTGIQWWHGSGGSSKCARYYKKATTKRRMRNKMARRSRRRNSRLYA